MSASGKLDECQDFKADIPFFIDSLGMWLNLTLKVDIYDDESVGFLVCNYITTVA